MCSFFLRIKPETCDEHVFQFYSHIFFFFFRNDNPGHEDLWENWDKGPQFLHGHHSYCCSNPTREIIQDCYSVPYWWCRHCAGSGLLSRSYEVSAEQELFLEEIIGSM